MEFQVFVVFNEQLLAKKVSGYRKFAFLLTIITTVVMAYFGVRAYIHAKGILSDYSVVKAQITHTEHRQEPGKKGLVKDIYEVSYEFDLNNRAFLASFKTNEDKFEQYQEGGLIKIAYSNQDPNKFERLELLKRQSDPRDLARRIGIVFVLVYLFFSIFVWMAKSKWKKRLGQPMEIED